MLKYLVNSLIFKLFWIFLKSKKLIDFYFRMAGLTFNKKMQGQLAARKYLDPSILHFLALNITTFCGKL